jgi:hypothetical protein
MCWRPSFVQDNDFAKFPVQGACASPSRMPFDVGYGLQLEHIMHSTHARAACRVALAQVMNIVHTQVCTHLQPKCGVLVLHLQPNQCGQVRGVGRGVSPLLPSACSQGHRTQKTSTNCV